MDYSVMREARVLNWLSGRLNVPEVLVLTAESAAGEYMITRCGPASSHGSALSNRYSICSLRR